MHTGRIVFAQLMDLLPLYEFQKCVRRYQSNYRGKNFSCLDQFLCMAFAQLTYRENLRDIEVCLRAFSLQLYHMGIRGNISRSTLADANENRDWHIYADFAQVLIGIARSLYIKNYKLINRPICPMIAEDAHHMCQQSIDRKKSVKYLATTKDVFKWLRKKLT